MKKLFWLWENMGRKQVFFAAGLLLAAFSSAMLMINPFLTRRLIDDVFVAHNTEPLLRILAVMMVVQLVRLGLRYIMVVCLEVSSQEMTDSIRRRIFTVMQHQDHFFLHAFRTGDLMTRFTSDLDWCRHFCSWICYNIVDCVVIFVSAIVFLFTVHWQLTVSLLVISPLIVFITRLYSRAIAPRYRELRAKLAQLNTQAQENIAGNHVVKAFAREDCEIGKFDRKNGEYRAFNLQTVFTGLKFQPILELLTQSFTIVALTAGGYYMITGSLTPGGMMAFNALTWALVWPLRSLSMLINDVQRFSSCSDMVLEIYNSEPTIFTALDALEKNDRLSGEIVFDNVSLTLGDKQVLKDISFTVGAGKTLGIVGPTGSGKTLLINLLNRFYEPTGGSVRIDGIDVGKLSLSFLRKHIGVAMQDVFLFSDTVANNISYARGEIPLEEIRRYATFADVDRFASRLSEGYDTLVGEWGTGLSGGQKQRISLARALASRPSILVLDDVTSAVDMETEQYIQLQLKHIDFDCTKIIIAQRISAVEFADEIIVLDNGSIIERGTHEELLAKGGYYRIIWNIQNNIEDSNGA